LFELWTAPSHHVAAGPKIALVAAGCMMMLVPTWVLRKDPSGRRVPLLKQLKLKAAGLFVGCRHILGCMESNTKQYEEPASADSVLLRL
jgi:hypothetical protein